jgi:hypothetical protein
MPTTSAWSRQLWDAGADGNRSGTTALKTETALQQQTNEPDSRGMTPLMLAAGIGCFQHRKLAAEVPEKMSVLLLQHEADLLRKDHNGYTALHWAAWTGYDRVVDIFLAHRRAGILLGAHIKDGRGYDGETALHLSARAGHAKCVTVLLEHAADFHATNAFYQIPMDVAGVLGDRRVHAVAFEKGPAARSSSSSSSSSSSAADGGGVSAGASSERASRKGGGLGASAADSTPGSARDTSTSASGASGAGASTSKRRREAVSAAREAKEAAREAKEDERDSSGGGVKGGNDSPTDDSEEEPIAELLNYDDRVRIRRLFCEMVPGCRTLLLHHRECMDHAPRKDDEWESPLRIEAIMGALERATGDGTDTAALFETYDLEVSDNFSRAPVETLKRVHTREYIKLVSDLSQKVTSSVPFTPHLQKLLRQPIKHVDSADTSFSAGSLNAARRAAGAVCHAVDKVCAGDNRNAFCVVRPPGHHAGLNGLLENAVSCGFCIFNNVMAGAMHAIHEKKLPCVAVVDFDVHHGNGTEEIVKHCELPGRLFFFSIHL